MQQKLLGSPSLELIGSAHGEYVGGIISGLPQGLKIDTEALSAVMDRRRPGGELVSARREDDDVLFTEGVENDIIVADCISFIIMNRDARADWKRDALRPSHADLAYYKRFGKIYQEKTDMAANGRMTAPLVVFGELCRQALAPGFRMETRIVRLGEYGDENGLTKDLVQKEIEACRASKDSVGGCIKTVISGVPAGLGEPFFDSFESRLSALLFSIPALVSVSFGDDEMLCSLRGSLVTDEITSIGGELHTISNHNGGLCGGMTNGEPIVFSCGFKPTPSIGIPVHSVTNDGRNTFIANEGRNDPCVMLRAIPVVEACAWYCLYYFSKE